jgi:hypothetical protein
MRLKNPAVTDRAGNVLNNFGFSLEPARLGSEAVPGFYIMNLNIDLQWLITANRVYPVTISTGFYVDHGDLLMVGSTE